MVGSEAESVIDCSIVVLSTFPNLILVNFYGFYFSSFNKWSTLYLFDEFLNLPEQRHQQHCESHQERLW